MKGWGVVRGFQSLFFWKSVFNYILEFVVIVVVLSFNPYFFGSRFLTVDNSIKNVDILKFQSLFFWKSVFNFYYWIIKRMPKKCFNPYFFGSRFLTKLQKRLHGTLINVSILIFLEVGF